MRVIIDSFSNDELANLEKSKRTDDNILSILRKNPMVSTWDISENRWMWGLFKRLASEGKIIDKSHAVGFPWNKYVVIEIDGAKTITKDNKCP
jgi:hypothetical protein